MNFYKRAFGAEKMFRFKDDKGDVTAPSSMGEAEFWLAGESPCHSNFRPESLGSSFDEDSAEGRRSRHRVPAGHPRGNSSTLTPCPSSRRC